MRSASQFIDGAGTYANVMKQVNSKKKMVEKLDLEQDEENEKYAGLREDAELPLKLEDGGSLRQPPVQIKNAGFGCVVISRPPPRTRGWSSCGWCCRTLTQAPADASAQVPGFRATVLQRRTWYASCKSLRVRQRVGSLKRHRAKSFVWDMLWASVTRGWCRLKNGGSGREWYGEDDAGEAHHGRP